MSRRPRIGVRLRRRITELDNHRCAYCRSPFGRRHSHVIDLLHLNSGWIIQPPLE